MIRLEIRLPCWTVCALALLFTMAPASAHEGHDREDGGQLMVVAGVVPGGPAAMAGLVEGDRIVSWDGDHLRTQAELDSFLGSRAPGERVALEVEREGETIDLAVTLGDRGNGRPSLGASLGVAAAAQTAPAVNDKVTSEECRTWIRETYEVRTLAAELGLELDDAISENSTCVDGDLGQMPPSIPRGWCDNVFKVHCSGLDLLAEIGDALIGRCESQLSAALGFDVGTDKTWNVCGEQKVFDAYSMHGTVSDEAACRNILVGECGAEIEKFAN